MNLDTVVVILFALLNLVKIDPVQIKKYKPDFPKTSISEQNCSTSTVKIDESTEAKEDASDPKETPVKKDSVEYNKKIREASNQYLTYKGKLGKICPLGIYSEYRVRQRGCSLTHSARTPPSRDRHNFLGGGIFLGGGDFLGAGDLIFLMQMKSCYYS